MTWGGWAGLAWAAWQFLWAALLWRRTCREDSAWRKRMVNRGPESRGR